MIEEKKIIQQAQGCLRYKVTNLSHKILKWYYHYNICKLAEKQTENMKTWIGYLEIKAKKCDCKEKDRSLSEQFINGINDNDMIIKILRELKAIKKTSEMINEQVLCWAKKV